MSSSTSSPEREPSPPGSSGSSSSEHDTIVGNDNDDLSVVTPTNGSGEGRRRRPSGMPPFHAVFVPLFSGGSGQDPAPAASIAALPVVEVSGPGAACCAICKEDLALAAAARRLPCAHLYHSPCIVPWLQVHNSCPVCRFRLPAVSSSPEPPGEQVVQQVPSAPPELDPPPSAAGGADDQLPDHAAVTGQGEEETLPAPPV